MGLLRNKNEAKIISFIFSFRVLFPDGKLTEDYFYVAKLFYAWSLKVK